MTRPACVWTLFTLLVLAVGPGTATAQLGSEPDSEIEECLRKFGPEVRRIRTTRVPMQTFESADIKIGTDDDGNDVARRSRVDGKLYTARRRVGFVERGKGSRQLASNRRAGRHRKNFSHVGSPQLSPARNGPR